ncbi:MAG TPA: DUF3618 domain-containing protein [Micromonosporaceae bacterium]|jgi:hypothetical protein
MTGTGRANARQDPAALRAEIERTRAELGETVQALAAKADVPARVRRSAAHRAEAMRDSVRQARRSPAPWFALGAAAAVIAVVLILRGRRR